MRHFLLGIGLWATLSGCSGADADEIRSTAKNQAVFDGRPDPRLAGTWASEDGVSTYRLDQDGTYNLKSRIKTPGRDPIESDSKGEWRVNGDRMVFRDERGDVVPYAFRLTGDTLELSLTGRLKAKTLLKRR